MKCPFCGNENTAVKDSRSIEDNTAIRRRRHCLECSARFSTVEHVQLLPLKVVKKNGIVEPFQREKLLRSFLIALHKRPIESERIDRIVNSIVRRLESRGETEIQANTIGELVMETLSDLDAVAYVRYASVYKNFHEPSDFNRFVSELQEGEKEA
jgi:transcriptional repressor NrdR